MVVVKNIVLNDTLVSMDCYINGKSERHFFLEFDVNSLDIVQNTCKESFTYVAKVRSNIVRTLNKENALPKETCVAWC